MKKRASRVLALICVLALVLALVPVMAFAVGDGWQAEGGRWKYYKNGAPLTGVNWIEAEGGRYIFDGNGILQTGDTEGDVLINGNLYHINPDKNLSDPKSCYAVRNYTRKRDAGVTYYDGDGITFVGWIGAGDGKLMYQTLVPKENVPGATKDIYIYVWRAQYIPAGKHPTTGAAIDAGWYLFGDDGILINTDGTYSCNDGSTYTVSGGKITAKDGQPVGASATPGLTESNTVPTIDVAHMTAYVFAFSYYSGLLTDYMTVLHREDFLNGKSFSDFEDYDDYFAGFFDWAKSIMEFNGNVESSVQTRWLILQDMVSHRVDAMNKSYWQNSNDAVETILQDSIYARDRMEELSKSKS